MAPDKLENVYKTVPGLGDIFVYGDSLKSVLVAIINIDPDEVHSVSQETGVSDANLEAFCKDPKVIDLFKKRLAEAHKEAKLNGFERIKKFYIDPV